MARGHLSKARDVLQAALATEIAHSYLTEDLARAEDRSGLRASAAARRGEMERDQASWFRDCLSSLQMTMLDDPRRLEPCEARRGEGLARH